jgi:peroxiredoxin
MSYCNSFAALALTLLAANAARTDDVLKVGDRVAKLTVTDIHALPRSLDDFGKPKATVLVFVNTTCPVASRYLPTLRTLEQGYREKGVQFIAVNAAEEDSLIAMATHAVKHEMEFPFVKDFGGACARALGVTRTPQSVVLDQDRRLCYRGRIDDQNRLGGVRKEPTTRDLADALDAVLARRAVANPETVVDGCPITFPKERKPQAVNYAEHVAPLLKKHCWSCHFTEGPSPFSLTSYKQASARAEALAEVVRDQRMPPWFASHEFGPFVNRRGLADDERHVLTDWLRCGTPEGDASKAPAPPAAATEKWQIATPDLVLHTTEYELPAAGDIPYKYAILLHPFAEDTWVQAAQIISDNPASLHHCNLAFAGVLDGFKEENFITGMVPGGEPTNLDDGIAFRIPKGSVLGLQIHFVSTGKPEKCRVSVGLRFPRTVVQKRLQNIQLTDSRFAIPPGAPAHRVVANKVLEQDVTGVGLFSHMHLRGKDMTFNAHPPAGKTDTLLIIPNYNFEWQVPYRWETGKKTFPKGTRLECIAHYDNSRLNPYNPDPLATVRNGLQTRQEMMFGFFFYTNTDEHLGITVDPKTGVQGPK